MYTMLFLNKYVSSKPKWVKYNFCFLNGTFVLKFWEKTCREVCLFLVCPAWVIARRCKSVMSLVVGIISWEQGCPLWSGIWKKLEAKSWPDEQKLHEAAKDGRVCQTKRSPILPESLVVDVAGRWDESYYPYLGRSSTMLWIFFLETTTLVVI